MRGPRTRPSQSYRAKRTRVLALSLFLFSQAAAKAGTQGIGHWVAVLALISHRHRALSAPSPPARLLLPFLWWWSRVHNSHFPYVRSGERQVLPELLGREAEDHIFDQLLRCGTDAITAVFSNIADLAAEVSCTRKSAIERAAVWQGSLIARHVPRCSWPRSAAAASAAQQHDATGPTVAVRSA